MSADASSARPRGTLTRRWAFGLAAAAFVLTAGAAAAQDSGQSPEQVAAQALIDQFSVHCLAFIDDLEQVALLAQQHGYRPLDAEEIAAIGARRGWYLPAGPVEMKVVLNDSGCAVIGDAVDVAAFLAAFEAAFDVRKAAERVGNTQRRWTYELFQAGRWLLIHLRAFAGAEVSTLAVIATAPAPETPMAADPAAAAAPAAPPPQAAAAPRPMPELSPQAGAAPAPAASETAPPAAPAPAPAATSAPSPTPPAAGTPPTGTPPAVTEGTPSELPLFTPAPASALQQALRPPAPPKSDRPVAPAGPPYDASRPSSEQRFVDFFEAACVANGTEYATMLSRAEQGGWEPVPPLAVREGFDFAWVAALPTGERFAVLFDSLKQSCCLSTYRVRKGWVLGALKDKLPLRAPASGQLGAKEVYNYDLGEWMRISADFETLEGNAVVASLCNTPR